MMADDGREKLRDGIQYVKFECQPHIYYVPFVKHRTQGKEDTFQTIPMSVQRQTLKSKTVLKAVPSTATFSQCFLLTVVTEELTFYF